MTRTHRRWRDTHAAAGATWPRISRLKVHCRFEQLLEQLEIHVRPCVRKWAGERLLACASPSVRACVH